jgi:hypothetical protein
MRTASPRTYRENRGRLSPDTLRPWDGQWVAFSPDGYRIVAGAPTLAELAGRLRTLGESPADVVLEHIQLEGEHISLGAAELP